MTQQGYKDISGINVAGQIGAPDTGELVEIPATAAAHISVAPEGHIVLVLPAGAVVTGSMASEAAEMVEKLMALQ